MKIIIGFLLMFLSLNCDAVNRPRGVPLSQASIYKENQPFTCLDGSATIAWSKVNDDYCDCRDASDEPGTSACSNGQFYCENKNYRGVYFPSSRVNDGICDCCDGSDEYTGLVSCKNNCWELGKAAREKAELRKKMREEGHRVYKEYVEHVKSTLETKRQRVDQIAAELADITAKKTALEEAKKESEAPETEAKEKHDKAWQEVKKVREEKKKREEAIEMFAKLDLNKDEKISVDELQSRNELDADSSGDVSAEEVRTYMEGESVDVEQFIQTVYPVIQNILKTAESQKRKPATEEDKEKEDKDENSEENESKEDSSDSSEAQDTKKEEKKVDEDKMPEYDEETKKLIAAADTARQALQEVETKFSSLESEKEDLKKLLDRDYGPDGAFFKLADSNDCHEYTDREYTYRLCLFKESTQRPKDGGGDTSLGNWGRWSGPEGNLYSEMLYENGQSCWNGPNRSTRVKIQCGSENKVESAVEPSRCEYMFVFSTPAACSQDPQDAHKEADHDEL